MPKLVAQAALVVGLTAALAATLSFAGPHFARADSADPALNDDAPSTQSQSASRATGPSAQATEGLDADARPSEERTGRQDDTPPPTAASRYTDATHPPSNDIPAAEALPSNAPGVEQTDDATAADDSGRPSKTPVPSAVATEDPVAADDTPMPTQSPTTAPLDTEPAASDEQTNAPALDATAAPAADDTASPAATATPSPQSTALPTIAPLAQPALQAHTSVAEIFSAARFALAGPYFHPSQQLRKYGVVTEGGLRGPIRCLQSGTDQYCDMQLGPLSERIQRHGSNFYRRDGAGVVRQLNGSTYLHEVTAATIEDFSFLEHPQWAHVAPTGQSNYVAVMVRAPGGDSEKVVFDRATGLMTASYSTAEDGPQTVLYRDYRVVSGKRLPYQMVIKRAAGEVYVIRFSSINLAPNIAPNAFALPISAHVHAAQIQTIGMTLRDEHWYIPVTIRGHSFEFLLDSGSQTTVLDPRVAAEIQLAVNGNFTLHGAKNVAGTGLTTLPELTVGAARFNSQPAIVTKLGTTTDGTARIDGILGFPFFAQAAVELDPQHSRLRLGEPGAFHFTHNDPSISLDRGVLEIAAQLAGDPRPAHFIVDTGSSDSVVLYDHFIKKYPDTAHVGELEERTYGIGGSAEAKEATLRELTIANLPPFSGLAGHVITGGQGAFANRLVAGNFGMALFGNAILGFDLQHNVFSVQSAPAPASKQTP